MSSNYNQAVLAATKVQAVSTSLKSSILGMSSLFEQISLSLVAGEHVIIYGPPGTAKSMIARSLAAHTGLTSSSVVLSPDHVMEDLVGPFDPQAFAQGRWKRVNAGLAVAHIGFVDEIGKGSGRVRNFLLSLMEERVLDSPTEGETSIPLQMVVAASNETLPEDESALVDRFLCSYVTKRIETPRDVQALLMMDTRMLNPVTEHLTGDDLVIMRDACTNMSNPLPKDIAEAVVEVLVALSPSPFPSPRRLKKSMRLLAASALLDGREEIGVSDLAVLQHTLYPNPLDFERRGEILDAINSVITRREGAMGAFHAAVGEVRGLLESNSARDKARGLVKASRLQREVLDPDAGIPDSAAQSILSELNALLSAMEAA